MTPELAERLAAIDAEVLDRVRSGRCGCGCGYALPVPHRGRGRNREPIPFEEGRQHYRDARCRQRVYHRRVEAAAEAQGAPTRLSLKRLQATTGTGKRHSDAQGAAQPGEKPRRRAPRPGLSVYFPNLAIARTVGRALRAARAELGPDGAGVKLDAAIAALDKAIGRHTEREASSR